MPQNNKSQTKPKASDEGALSEAPIQEYAITVKATTKINIQNTKLNELFLLEFYVNLCNKYNMVRLVSVKEYDSKGVPHIHGTVLCPKMPYFREKGWHIYITKKLTTHWEDYIQKEYIKIKKEQENLRKFYESSYQFIDNQHISPYILSFAR